MLRGVIYWSVAIFIGLFIAGLLGGTLGPLIIGMVIATMIRNVLVRLFPGDRPVQTPAASDDHGE
ncbi:MAG: hypothetical protein AB7P33_13730 [Dehalococcoidia bacterium]